MQVQYSIALAFTAIERDLLIKAGVQDAEAKRRLKDIEFMMDELAIFILERQPSYEC